ncbi:MAG: NUDIX hydrolase [Peptococcaceae bacterium]|nr:NUDIX hydrolase [Peptococcaceae bacterium]
MKTYLKQIREFVPGCRQEEKDKELILAECARFPEEVLTRRLLTGHLTSSGLILSKNYDKILMVHHNIYKTWTWTGGHADGEEDLLAVALKEAGEETGLVNVSPILTELAALDVIPVFGHVKNGAWVSAHLHYNAAYLLEAEEKAALRINPAENSGVKWVPLAEVAGQSREPVLIDIFNKMLKRLGEGLSV